MRYSIEIYLKPYDKEIGAKLMEVHGASEETLNLILSNYNGAAFCVEVNKEEAELVNPVNDILPDMFTIRTFNCLRRGNIHSLIDLIKSYNKGELKYLRNLGAKSFAECETYLLVHNLIKRRNEE